MIQLNNVSIFVSANGRKLVGDLSFTLNPGDRTVIIGEEGNGKSTLLKLIYDPALIESHAEYTGSVYRGSHRLGYLAQELEERYAALSVSEFIGLDAGEVWRAEAYAAEAGLHHHEGCKCGHHHHEGCNCGHHHSEDES